MQTAQLDALREGAFLTGAQQGKFDFQRGDRCKHCGFLDTMEHRVLACPFYAHVRSRHPAAIRAWPQCSIAERERLLPNRNPFYRQLKFALWNGTYNELGYSVAPADVDRQNLFSDGSSFRSFPTGFEVAAWALVSADLGQVVMAAPLPGLLQTAGRAELYALLRGVQWSLHFEVPITLWSDSAYATSGLCAILAGDSLEWDSNEDLWETLVEAVACLSPGQVWVQHVPGHSSEGQIHDVDSWQGYWNQSADTAAGSAHWMRGEAFWRLWDQYCSAAQEQKGRILDFEALHLDLAAQNDQTALSNISDAESDEEVEQIGPQRPLFEHYESWFEGLPLNWKQHWCTSRYADIYGQHFVCEFVEFLGTEETSSCPAAPFSWLELAALIYSLGMAHPLPISSPAGHVWRDASLVPVSGHSELSVASRVRFVSGAIRSFVRLFNLPLTYFQGLDRSDFRVFTPLSGAGLILCSSSVTKIDGVLNLFTRNSIRRANDLSRPFSR